MSEVKETIDATPSLYQDGDTDAKAHLDADELRLAQMGKSIIHFIVVPHMLTPTSGHAQELKRHFTILSLIGLASTTTISWTGLGLGLVSEINAGGPGAVIYGFLLVFTLQCFLGASLAEFVSSYPTEGYVQVWHNWHDLHGSTEMYVQR